MIKPSPVLPKRSVHAVMRRLAVGIAWAAISAQSLAASIQVVDQTGAPLEDAVIELISQDAVASTTKSGTMTQQGLLFVPYVLAVKAGTAVEFPNKDKTRHHVYSFSEPKVFELKLYAGKPEKPVLFDKPGIVVLGCNIHDHMQAFVYVGTSALLAVSDAKGNAEFSELPSGTATLKVWHPWQTNPVAEQQINLSALPATLTVPITPSEKPKPPKRGFGQSY